MKNKPFIFLLTLSVLLCSNYSKAQFNVLPSYGNVGIYDLNPKSALSVNGGISFSENYPYIRTIRGRADTTGKQNTGLEIYSSYNGSDGASIILFSKAAKNNPGSTEVWSNGQNDEQALRILRRINNDSSTSLLSLKNNGRLGIGDNWPDEMLSVNGNIAFSKDYPFIRTIRGRSDTTGKQNTGLEIYSSYNGSDGASIILLSKAAKNNPGSTEIWSNGHSDAQAFRILRQISKDSSSSLLSLKNSGKLGIGDNWPDEVLTVNGNIAFSKGYTNIRTIRGRSDSTGAQNTGLEIYSSYNGSDGSALLLFSNASQYNPGSTEIWSCGSEKNQALRVSRRVNTDSSATLFKIENSGKVIIGNDINSNTAYNYGLYVEKGILTEKLRVANKKDAVNWADFVFKKEYNLMSLYELESYIKKHNHLPEIPTADEVAKYGIDVASMDAKLLQKVEELTLHVIRLQKEIDELKKNQQTRSKK